MKIKKATIRKAVAPTMAVKLSMLSREKLQKFITRHPEHILDVRDADRELRKIALTQMPEIIRHLHAPTEDDYLDAVRSDGLVIEYIKQPSKKVVTEAILNNPNSVEYIKDLTLEQTKAAIIADPFCIRHIDPLDKEMLGLAVRTKGLAIQFIDNPEESIQLQAVKENPSAISMIKEPTPKVLEAAITQDGLAIEFVDNPEEPLQMLAVENSDKALALRYIKEPTPNVQRAAYFRNKRLLAYLPNPPKEVQIDAVSANPENISLLEEPCEEVQKLLIKNLKTYPNILDDLPKVTKKVIDAYLESVKFDEKTERLRMIYPKKDVARYLGQNQLRILRYMDQKSMNAIPCTEIKNKPWAEGAWFKRLIANRSDIDVARIVELSEEPKPTSELAHYVLDTFKLARKEMGESNSIFDEKVPVNFIVYVEPHRLKEYDIDPTVVKTLRDYISQKNEPYLSKMLTISSVQYTIIHRDIWVDDVDASVLSVLSAGDKKSLFFLYIWTLNLFVREMRTRGYQKIYMPQPDMRSLLYGEAVENKLIDALAAEALFVSAIINNIDPLVNGKEAHVLL